MPVNIKTNLPAKVLLENENIFVMDEARANSQDIRPLELVILNLMPIKEETELELLRMLSNTPLQVKITLLRIASHESKNTCQSHLNEHYLVFDEIKHKKFDGMIITGAPLEQYEFSEITYYDELVSILEWSKSNVFSTLHICYGAMFGLNYHYNIAKIPLKKKLSGVFYHDVIDSKDEILRGIDDVFLAPHSRHSGIDELALANHKSLVILAKSDLAGSYLIRSSDRRQVFVLGHPEYSRTTLDNEYKRDIKNGLDVDIPYNYYKDDNPNNPPKLTWRAHANCVYINWLNYYVYQTTPFELDKLNSIN
ncbi:homoserine O-succinyltransferase [Campylobacter sp. RM12640]|uniref:homoserine O-succinyltransferase n=1 Tax=unclassified Campylobacter TaxID=2593542 RepID=UPI001BD9FC45|nr:MULTISPECIES: homoserine O-succinyltransferase [unclassified Campylobacter]MBZ7975520.1 homoserine O-succinyltransferase [Campylobacter sp. RM12637]MBZ7978554.1 homoserine O-succinyltransferase [Campylobacter sp. RM12654]MBZ7979349.1 homoserine O-succinyltransferase [Campylobacter sp. RM12642]MBZ7981079.1 homoserine O-succinyltransferase [Campylobacter sp. RM12640]MBZ7988398.1 homoserine O-succinyltransferase [Campylobacter sp. RM12635]MBZ7992449.1 homoserine O-succinyltransferase [Campylo